ncbi:MAG: hypothetical protein Q8934_11415 [Bacillota bacterium]|nr:hypothetical protein [Bacillota bacterium]
MNGMKKMVLSSLLLLLFVTIVGCSISKTSSQSKFTDKSALKMAINHYNKYERGKIILKIPLSLIVGKTVSKEIPVGPPNNKTKLDFKNSVKPSGTNYIVTLIEDEHYVVNGTKAISYWKYEVSPNGIKLLDKNENGGIIRKVK